jgi:hypothetical protein
MPRKSIFRKRAFTSSSAMSLKTPRRCRNWLGPIKAAALRRLSSAARSSSVLIRAASTTCLPRHKWPSLTAAVGMPPLTTRVVSSSLPLMV